MNMLRDLPRYVRLLEAGSFNGEALLGQTYSIDDAREAFQAVADRRVISAVVTF